MILTITINPLLEYRLAYPKIVYGRGNRNPVEKYSEGGEIAASRYIGGGKGINVSRQLKNLGLASLAFTFLGGNNGKRIAECLKSEGIQFTSVRTASESRICPVVLDIEKKRVTSFFGNNSVITENEVDEFKGKMEKMIQNCEYVVFAGSSPCESCDSIFPFGIEIANKYDKISVLDTYGKHLEDCIKASPTIIHNNLEELIESFKDNPKFDLPTTNYNSLAEEEVLSDEKLRSVFDYFYSSGIKQVYLTNGKYPTNAANFDYRYKVENPVIEAVDATGSGDAFVAGIIYGHFNDLVFEEYLAFATKLGMLNAQRFDVCNISLADIERSLIRRNETSHTAGNENSGQHIRIIPIGKKMKVLDVTPRYDRTED